MSKFYDANISKNGEFSTLLFVIVERKSLFSSFFLLRRNQLHFARPKSVCWNWDFLVVSLLGARSHVSSGVRIAQKCNLFLDNFIPGLCSVFAFFNINFIHILRVFMLSLSLWEIVKVNTTIPFLLFELWWKAQDGGDITCRNPFFHETKFQQRLTEESSKRLGHKPLTKKHLSLEIIAGLFPSHSLRRRSLGLISVTISVVCLTLTAL